MHDFRAFVHSDCGGHGSRSSCPGGHDSAPPEDAPCGTPNDAALLRWTAHCVLGTIVRFHQGDHRFWLRPNGTLAAARSYLTMRHALAPSLIAAGRTLQRAGFPLTARCDLLWPAHAAEGARDPTQYVHLNATLVAPLDVEPTDKVSNSRSVWVPPGDWIDGWSGASVRGPRTINVTQPADKIPMWHKAGAVLVTDGTAARWGREEEEEESSARKPLRLVHQQWSELTIEAFPAAGAWRERRDVYEQEGSAAAAAAAVAAAATAAPTTVELRTFGNGTVAVSVSGSPVPRAWVVRLHLRPGQRLALLARSSSSSSSSSLAAVAGGGRVEHLLPAADCAESYFPFRGAGARPACEAGAVAEFRLPSSAVARRIEATIEEH